MTSCESAWHRRSSMERAASNDRMTGPELNSFSPGLRLDEAMREVKHTTPTSPVFVYVPHGVTLWNSLEITEPHGYKVVSCGACTSGSMG